MATILLYDGLYTGHHNSYAKGLVLNTEDSQLVINKNKEEMFKDIPDHKIKILNCKDPKSFKVESFGWLVNFLFLMKLNKFHAQPIHFLYADKIVVLIYLYSIFIPKYFMTIHWANAVCEIKKDNKLLKTIYRKLKFFAFNQVSKKSLGTMVHGLSTFEKLSIKYPLSYIKEIPYGIDGKKKKVNSDFFNKHYKKKILFFGGIRRDKGIERLAEITSKHKDLHFVIAGKPIDYSEEEIRLMFTNKENVTFLLEFIKDSEIENLFNDSDLLILPYEYYFSGQSGPLTLAAKYNIPVIATNVGDMGLDVQRFNLGIAVPDNTVGNLSNAIQEFYKMKNNYSSNLTNFYNRGLWSEVGKTIDEVYKNN